MVRLALDCAVPDAVLASLHVGPAKRTVIRSLCRRAMRIPLEAWLSGLNIGGRNLSLSLALPYFTYRPHQLWRRLRWELIMVERRPTLSGRRPGQPP